MSLSNLAFDSAEEATQREHDAWIARVSRLVKADGSDICIDCGVTIPKARRLAAPFARRCLDCAEIAERR